MFGPKNLFDNALTVCSVREVENIIICFDVNNLIILGGKKIFYKIVNDSQLFIGKNVLLEEKAHFFGYKTVNQCSCANSKKPFFC